MNRTAITLGIMGLVAIMFGGIIVLAIVRPDATAIVIAFCGSTLATLISAVVMFYGLDKTNKKIDKVERQTNGINSALLARATGMSEQTIDRHKGVDNV